MKITDEKKVCKVCGGDQGRYDFDPQGCSCTRPAANSRNMLHLAVSAVLEADTEFRKQMMPGWEGDPLSDEIDGLRRVFTAALAVQTQQGVEEDLDARMKGAGMYTIAEMMGVTPLTKWKSNPAINTLDAFSEWLDRKVSEYLTMKVGYDLGDKSTDDELYEWVEAHAAVFGTIRDQFQVVRSALVDVPAVESEPVAWRPSYQQIKDVVQENVNRMHQAGESHLMMARWLSADIDKLYAHPPRSLSNEGWMPIETAPKDGTVVDLWGNGRRATDVAWGMIRDWMGKEREGWEHGMPDDFEPTHWQPLPTPPLSTRKGSAGDGSATGTKGAPDDQR